MTSAAERFIDHYADPPANTGEPAPSFDVTGALQVCPGNASSLGRDTDEPGPRFTAASFAALAPNSLQVSAPGTQATTNPVPGANAHAKNADPVGNLATNGGACPVEQSPGGLASAGPGVATYDSQALDPRLHHARPDPRGGLAHRHRPGQPAQRPALRPGARRRAGPGRPRRQAHHERERPDHLRSARRRVALPLRPQAAARGDPGRRHIHQGVRAGLLADALGRDDERARARGLGNGGRRPRQAAGRPGRRWWGPTAADATGGGSGASSALPPCASPACGPRAASTCPSASACGCGSACAAARASRPWCAQRGPRRWARTSLRKNAGRPLVTLRVSRRARPGRHRLKVRISCAGRRPQTVYRRVRFVP